VQATTVGFGIRIFKKCRDRISYGYKRAMIPVQKKQQYHTNRFDKVGQNNCCGDGKAELQLTKLFDLFDSAVSHGYFEWLPR